ncbi:GvpL/GvpF family gas vesicle protein [Streptomyces sp. NA04227]|uniref:GvpL/GvpF family gas vesicle protein n=1 Tax=Streptomyces sp. NA04227 TaxID=2742136 RepID=UPI001591BC92|nr:GvpL/GvpF family gas vesicle protein [Streptomyces sp. NA04227]QKW10387.1 GvpL/GvpF family gas vesicle protein [Streptomyces sp. NA04227]
MSTYVYAVTRADHPLRRLAGLAGIGDPPLPLRTVRTEQLTAVVSDAPTGLRAKRRDVLAHQTVIEALMADGATLPMRFGLLASDDNQVIEALGREEQHYRERLTDLDGQVEYNLKTARDEDDLLREIMTRSDRIRQLNDHTRDGSGTHEDRVALGELVSREVEARHSAEAIEVLTALAPAATRVFPSEATAGDFLNVAFLVPRNAGEEFVEAVQTEADRHGDAYAFTLTGPLPPYSFV